MSVRETILANLKTALDGVTSVKIVSRDAVAFDELDESKTPALLINDAGEDEPLSPIGTDQRVRVNIRIEGKVIASRNLSTTYNDFLAEVRKVLHSASLGGNVIYSRLGAHDSFLGERIIYFWQNFTIVYYYPEANP